MSSHDIKSAVRPEPDQALVDIAEYAANFRIESQDAYDTAYYCLMDTLACGFQALKYPACTKLLGPVVPGATMTHGARVPGTSYELDPVMGAFNIGAMVRWLDFNDTWLAAEWGHPSDNLGGILAVADYLSRKARNEGKKPLVVRDILTAMIKAHEIQGVLAIENSFNRVGLDHVILVRVASTAVVTQMLGGSKDQIINAVSNAWIDGGALRTYRHAPNTGSRKSWAAGDATSRAVRHAFIAMTGEMGYPSALSAKTWGFFDVLFKGKPFTFQRGYGSYVMENVLFKISFPAEFHSQTAVEAAMTLHPKVKDKIDQIAKIVIETQEPGVRIIDKTGPLSNPADRDHCIQYMTVVPLIFGRLTAADYEDGIARDPRIDALRAKTEVKENPTFTEEYYAQDKRYIGNAVQVFFNDGTKTERVSVDFPIGHRKRRAEGMPVLVKKFESSVAGHFESRQSALIQATFADKAKLLSMPVNDFIATMVKIVDAANPPGGSMNSDERDLLAAGALELGLKLEPGQLATLIRLVDELERVNSQFNLTAIRDRRGMLQKHVLDSLTLQAFIQGHRVADVGTGAGFPGLPLAVINPARRFTLIDATGKKARFVEQTARHLDCRNVEVVNKRAETYRPFELFDTVIARALSSVADFIAYAGHLCAPGGDCSP